MAETKKAFKKLPNLEQAITALSNLKGVGTTMASALLAAASPENAPFMADECLMAIPEIEGIDYTTKEYLNFVQHIQTTVTRLNKQCECSNSTWQLQSIPNCTHNYFWIENQKQSSIQFTDNLSWKTWKTWSCCCIFCLYTRLFQLDYKQSSLKVRIIVKTVNTTVSSMCSSHMWILIITTAQLLS